jgi:hypothetical protein
VLVCAISKICSIITYSGDFLIDAVSLTAYKVKIWYYHLIAKFVSVLHKAEIFLVKLNKKSGYIFILEIYKDQTMGTDYSKMIVFFAYILRDLAFPGYPYWLIKADYPSRFTNDEYEMLITSFFAMNRYARKMLFPLIKAVDAHLILDNIR